MLKFSGSVQSTPPRYGKFPSVSINTNGDIVEVHQPSMISTDIYYQVGEINQDEVDWVTESWIDAGKFPKVAINDNNCVVVVHEGRTLRRIYCHIGALDGRRITWGGRNEALHPLCLGRLPAVAVNGNRCVITFDSAHMWYTTHYCLGDIDPGNNRLMWKVIKGKLFESGATETSITINENFALAAGRSWFNRIVYRIGRFVDGDHARIQWLTDREIHCNYKGYCPNICLDNDGYVVMNWQSQTMRRLFYATGRIITLDQEDPFIDWNTKRSYDFGYNPTIALSANDGQVMEEHETNFAPLHRCTLHWRIGNLQKGLGAEVEQPAGENREPDGENEAQRNRPHHGVEENGEAVQMRDRNRDDGNNRMQVARMQEMEAHV